MGIISINELDVRGSTQGSDWKRTYKRTWRVLTDDRTIGSKTVRSACPVSIGNVYSYAGETDAGAYCLNISADQEQVAEGDGLSWIVAADYGPYDPTVNPQSPLDRPCEVSWTYATFEEVIDEDKNGNAVVNSAYDYFDPPITRDRSRPILVVDRYERGFSVSLTDMYNDSVNSDEWFGADPGTVKLKPVGAQLLRDPDIGWYWKRHYEFEYNPKGWKIRPLDQGMRKLAGTTPEKQIPITVGGSLATAPVLLDGEGGELAPGSDPVYLEFEDLTEVPFADLGFTEDDFPGITF